MPRNLRVERALAAERAAPFNPSTRALASRQRATMEPPVFAIRNLSVLAYAQGFTLRHHRAGAARLDETGAEGFFDAAADMFAVGDMLMAGILPGILIGVLGLLSPTLASLASLPIPLIILPVIFCSFYTATRDVFGLPDGITPRQPDPLADERRDG